MPIAGPPRTPFDPPPTWIVASSVAYMREWREETYESVCDRLNPARQALTAVEIGTGEVACIDMHSMRIEGMKAGTS